MSLRDHCLLSLNDNGDWERCLKTGGKKMSLIYLRRARRGAQETVTYQPHLDLREGKRKILEAISRCT